MKPWSATLDAAAPWVAGLLLATPVLVAYYPPSTDLPYHEAAIGILRHFGDASMFPPSLYEHNLGEPNQLFHTTGWALSYLMSTRWAVKLIVAAAVCALPVCGARFSRHVGASPLSALALAPIALGWLLSWGLVANLIGLATLLAVLPWLDDFARRPARTTALWALGAVPLLYFAHEAMMSVYAGMAIVLAVVCPWSSRRTPARLAPAVLAGCIHAAQLRWVQQFMTPAVRAMPILWHPLLHKLERVPYVLVPATDVPVELCVFLLCVIAIATFFWLRTDERRAEDAPPAPGSHVERARAFAYLHRWELLALGCFGLYLALPLTMSTVTLAYHRFFPPGYALLAIAAAPRDLWTRKARATRLVLLALPAATLFVAWPSFADSDRVYRALDRVLPYVERGSALAQIGLGPVEPSRPYSLNPASGRILATRGGRLAYAFTDSQISPVVTAKPYQWNESLLRLAFDPLSFRPAHDCKSFAYILLRTTDPAIARAAVFALRREASYVTDSDGWILLRSRGAVAPLTSAELPMEDPPPETLRERIRAIVATMPADTPPVP